MKKAIPLTRDNIHMVADAVNIPVDDLWNKLNQAKAKQIMDAKIEAACNFFGEDRHWYDRTMVTVRDIEKSLPQSMDHKERTNKMYGWIKTAGGKCDLRLPLEMDLSFAHASAVRTILTDYDLYMKIMNWD